MIITPLGFAEALSNKTMSTVDNADLVAVAVPDSITFTTVGIYQRKQETKIDITGATYSDYYEPVASVVLTPGVHLIRKRPHHHISVPSEAKNVFATAVREQK
jgi:hypothetical protein